MWRALIALLLATSAGAQCVGDCNGDARVTVDELTTGVRQALEKPVQPTDYCIRQFDMSGDEHITVNELVAATGYALRGCVTCPRFQPRYTVPCAMAVATVRCRPPTSAVTLPGWAIESDGHLIRLQLLGTEPTVTFFGELTGPFHARLTGLKANRFDVIEPQEGAVDLTNGIGGQILTLSNLNPLFALDECRSSMLFGTP